LVPTGTRIDYVITSNGGYNAKQSVKVEEEAFYRAYRSIIKLDFLFYLEHQLCNPLNEIIEKAFKKHNIIGLLYKQRVAYHKVVQQLDSIFSARIVLEDEEAEKAKKEQEKEKEKKEAKKKVIREIKRKIIEDD
jgi:hypothetical protein